MALAQQQPADLHAAPEVADGLAVLALAAEVHADDPAQLRLGARCQILARVKLGRRPVEHLPHRQVRTQPDALSAIMHGDIAAVGAVISAGEPRFVGRSRNTPGTTRAIRVAACGLARDFSGARG